MEDGFLCKLYVALHFSVTISQGNPVVLCGLPTFAQVKDLCCSDALTDKHSFVFFMLCTPISCDIRHSVFNITFLINSNKSGCIFSVNMSLFVHQNKDESIS